MSRAESFRRRDAGNGESGAILILALVYILAIGLVVGALADWASSNLDNTTNFQSASNLHTALTGVANTAIESIRYSPIPASPSPSEYAGTATAPGGCWGSATTTSELTIDDYTVNVWCSTVLNLDNGALQSDDISNITRAVTLYACVSSFSESQCLAAPQLKVLVGFDDYFNTTQLSEQCNLQYPEVSGACGNSQDLVSWVWN